MTFRTIQGVPFQVLSPSHYVLSGEAYATSHIDLCVVSFEADRAWHVAVLLKRGHSIHRGPFKSLAEAVALIARQSRGVA